LLFELGTADSAPAMRAGPSQGTGFTVKQFADGFTINVAEKESVPLAFEATLPSDSIEWHVEADIVVGGDRRTVVIDNEGRTSTARAGGWITSTGLDMAPACS
jgi:hypothetical protein